MALALVAVFVATIPAAAFSSLWTKPKRVFAHDTAPTHSMVSDAAGKVHIASERGSAGVWYITDASGPWTRCQISHQNDRHPSIAVDGGVVHIAFARMVVGQRGIYTASSNQPGAEPGCGWAVTKRRAGGASHPSMAARGGTLHIAFRSPEKKLRYLRGKATASAWAGAELIDKDCCTSPVALALTSAGAPRVAYGDGVKRTVGLKYGARTGKGWKWTRVYRARIKHVALTIDHSPGVFAPPSNAPRIAFVAKRKGTLLASKGSSSLAGGWGFRTMAKSFGPVDIQHRGNVTQIVYVSGGNLQLARAGGPIWIYRTLSRTRSDTKPQLDGGRLTYSRYKGPRGVFYSRLK
jgi:hypothetical protein